MKKHEEEIKQLELEKIKEIDELNKKKEEMKSEADHKFHEEIAKLMEACFTKSSCSFARSAKEDCVFLS